MNKNDLKHFFGTISAKSLSNLPYDPKCPIPKGARIEKIKEDTPGGDLHPIGSRGYTIGGFMKDGVDAYFVQWDIQKKMMIPGTAGTIVAVMGWKIKQIGKPKKKP